MQIELIGEWNEETAIMFVSQCREKIKALQGRSSSILALLDNFVLAVPEAMTRAKEFMVWAIQMDA